MTHEHAVTCPRCAGTGHTENAVAECGDTSVLCETCRGVGHVPTRWAAMHYMSHDKTCDYCDESRGAAWDGELFTCVECWEAKNGKN